jgi:hypothetical protein
MTALTNDAPLRIWGVPVTKKGILDTSIAQNCYRGCALIVDQSADTTHLTVFTDKTHPVVDPADVFVGIAAEKKIVAVSDPETLADSGVEMYVEPTIVGFKSTVFTAGTDDGKAVYMTDSGVLVGVAGVADAPYLGKIMWIEDGYCYVKLALQICTGA